MYGDNDSYFSRYSMVREIFGQKQIADLIGVRALVIQALQGLGFYGLQKSRLFEQPIPRLKATATAMETLYFGTKEEADAVAARVNRGHSYAHGVVINHQGNIPDGTVWDANDPDEQRWVIASVMDSAISVYVDFVAPLSPSRCDQFVREYQVIAKMLGAPDSYLFESYSQLQRYMKAMYATFNRTDVPPAQRLELTEESRLMVLKSIFEPDIELLKLIKEHVEPVIKGVLPQEARQAYKIEYSQKDENSYRRSCFALKNFIYHTRNGMLIAPWLYTSSLMAALANYATPGPKHYRPAQ